ncbi:protein of unknown function (plasmid) [Caballeronia sp. S22]
MPRRGSAKKGVHLGAMSGVLDVLVRQYAGIEFANDAILLRPCWSQDLPPVRVSLRFQQQLLRLHATPEFTTLQADKKNRRTVKFARVTSPTGSRLEEPFRRCASRQGTAYAAF